MINLNPLALAAPTCKAGIALALRALQVRANSQFLQACRDREAQFSGSPLFFQAAAEAAPSFAPTSEPCITCGKDLQGAFALECPGCQKVAELERALDRIEARQVASYSLTNYTCGPLGHDGPIPESFPCAYSAVFWALQELAKEGGLIADVRPDVTRNFTDGSWEYVQDEVLDELYRDARGELFGAGEPWGASVPEPR